MADLGGGTGWYSSYLLDRLPEFDGVLLDASVAAAKIAARAHPRLSVATADLWQSIPLPDSSCAVTLVVFAPRNPTEIARVLTPGGVCLVVTPQADHLRELRDTFPMLGIDPHKEQRLTEQFADFDSEPAQAVRRQTTFTADDLVSVMSMGPSAFHTSPEAIAALATGHGPMDVTVSVLIHRFVRALPDPAKNQAA
jgi:23S rRNA (guanine745-N1)-methyltransferase